MTDDLVSVARVDESGTVVNIEMATDEWLSRPETRALGYRFIPYTADNPAHIGGTYDDETGTFTDPPRPAPLPNESDHE